MTISAANALKTEVTLLSVSFAFVLTRLYIQIFKLRAFGAPDLLIAFAFICYTVNVVLDFHLHHFGFWDNRIKFHSDGQLPDFDVIITNKQWLLHGLKLQYATYNFYFLELYSIKASFLMLYLRLFPPGMVRLRGALFFTIVLCAVGVLSTVLLNFFYCHPISLNWTMDPKKRCLTWASVNLYIYAGGMNIITDILVYALPFFLIPPMYRNASRSKIAGAFAVFVFGTLSMVCTVIRLVIIGRETDTARITAWYTAEQASAIICACLPPLKWFFTRSVSRVREHINWSDWSGVWRKARSRGSSSDGSGMGDTKGTERTLGISTGGRTVWTTGTVDDPGLDLEQHVLDDGYSRGLAPRQYSSVGDIQLDKGGITTIAQPGSEERKHLSNGWTKKFKGKLVLASSKQSSACRSHPATFGEKSPIASARNSVLGTVTGSDSMDATHLPQPPSHCFLPSFVRRSARRNSTASAGFGFGYMNAAEDANRSTNTIDDESILDAGVDRLAASNKKDELDLNPAQDADGRRKATVRISAVVESQSNGSHSIRSCRTGSSRGGNGCDNVRGSCATPLGSFATLSVESLVAGSFTFGRRTS